MKIIKNENYTNPFIIVNEENGEIIDDAQGYGFKTYEKAKKCYYFKNKYNNPKKYKQRVKNLKKKYPELIKIENEIQEWLFYSLKDGEEIHKNHIKNKILKEIKLRIPELNELFEEDKKLKDYYLNYV